MIKITAGAVVAAKLAGAVEGRRFFTPEEFAALDELTEFIIPTDERGGGAKAARVAEFMDRVLAEAEEQKERDEFRAGLAPYVTASSAEREALLAKASANEMKPTTAEEKFFRTLKEQTIHGYYTSKIGIEALDYKGNVYQTGEYAGYLPS
jgi:hypothetical protein